MSDRIPFANGTAQECWMSSWCAFCKHDHEMHEDWNGPGCDLTMFIMMPEDLPWPEAWVAAPDFGFHLPARIACLKFEPCTEDGCTGDKMPDRPGYVASILDDFRKAAS